VPVRHVPSPLPPAQNRTTQLARLLGAEIRANKFRPGQRLPTEQEMIAQYQVSRTVVREAIASLRAEGLVVTRQGSGAFVAENPAAGPFHITAQELHSVSEILDVMQLRLAVEVEAAALAAENRNAKAMGAIEHSLDVIDEAVAAGADAVEEDFAFHFAIAAATGNSYFERFMRFLGTVIIPRQTVRLGMEDPESRRAYLVQIQAEHRLIYAAIRDASVEGARRAARAHLESARDRYARLLRTGG